MYMEIQIICNEKGTGKTTYVLQKFKPNKYYSPKKFDGIESIKDDVKDTDSYYGIIDSADEIPEKTFENVINAYLTQKCKEIIIVFDVPQNNLLQCDNFMSLWRAGFLSPNFNYENFRAEDFAYYDFLSQNYPNLDSLSYDTILELTNHNFNNINLLMLVNKLEGGDKSNISNVVLGRYINTYIKERFKDMPEMYTLLRQSSIVGERFIYDALLSPQGFGCELALAYLKKIEDMHCFIRNCIDSDEQYEFISHDMYLSIYEGIPCEDKIEWIKILIRYYENHYKHASDDNERIKILKRLKNLYQLIPALAPKSEACRYQLFYEYRKINDIDNSFTIATEIADDIHEGANTVLGRYIQGYRIELLVENGEYSAALDIIKKMYEAANYLGSRMLLKYYYSLCLYNTGDVDLSYTLILEIRDYLKESSGTPSNNQELFCMVYSLLATLQNHFGIDDGGFRYYELALNHACELENKQYYYEILKKCDMFYEYIQLKKIMLECAYFYEQNEKYTLAGEAYLNLATEMLFQDCSEKKTIKEYLKKTVTYFANTYNKKLSYAYNNMGIYYVIAENDIEKGLLQFRDALFMGLSDFSYMSIYLNICMCYVLLHQTNSNEFISAQQHFMNAVQNLKERKNEAIYIAIYEKLFKIIMDEQSGNNVLPDCQDMLKTMETSSFFYPIIEDIIRRNTHRSPYAYKENISYYESMNRLQAFFAEFRFWE